ncbi:50S ribosomal protein L22 [Candidatus Nardonella dryophthoridicola]|uniref:Large ribosomal subunit protein uL22 n=1 Tax=endosymbiont of Rhynchophorus ferrugineus TaxID=1972133 RepID=A0A2Z5T959_9GAMM|nr:50S ribosomal protein L22 [Candidatus Nardonella dryophthoridicola]BBA85096.1 50S ribosomal protein L22 [endosymbiont of Rhynchophorus ferrugineus]
MNYFIFSRYKNARISPSKLRLILKIIDYSNIFNTINILKFSNKKGSFLIKKTIESAISNAEHNYNLNIDYLKIHRILIDKGPILKRIMFRARGRFDNIFKKTSIITVILSNKK